MRLENCHNFHDFRALARRKLPAPIFNYIDGAADDEATLRQNAASFERCDLVPNVLRGVETIAPPVPLPGGGHDLYVWQEKFHDAFAAAIHLVSYQK
jgi:L-lactate dehydrogenase (cytochrome)